MVVNKVFGVLSIVHVHIYVYQYAVRPTVLTLSRKTDLQICNNGVIMFDSIHQPDFNVSWINWI